MGLHLCSISGGKKEGPSGGAGMRANLESSGRKVRRAVREEKNEEKRNGRRWIKTEEKEDKEEVLHWFMWLRRIMRRILILT